MSFETKSLSTAARVKAPDGSDVSLLPQLKGGSMIHIELAVGLTTVAVAHRTVDELWYFLDGRGEMWRKDGETEETVAVEAGVAVSIPAGTSFQFRSFGLGPLSAVAVTMPPWPGMDEAYPVDGPWEASTG